MKSVMIVLLTLASLQCLAQLSPMTLEEAKNLIEQPTEEIQDILSLSPKTYDFSYEDRSTVNYTGQVMRQVLINDAKIVYSSMNRSQMENDFSAAYAKLNSYYNYNFETNGLTPFLLKANGVDGGNLSILEGLYYADIFPRAINLYDKMAGIDNPLSNKKMLGWSQNELEGIQVDIDKDGLLTPDELMKSLMTLLARNISSSQPNFTVQNGSLELQEVRKAHITESGLDLAEFSQKLFHSALSFSQASGDYLSIDLGSEKGLLADNDQLLTGSSYTTLQHHWDEAYGYIGFARNSLDYTDEQLAKGLSLDSYEDTEFVSQKNGEEYWEQVYGKPDYEISLLTEKNLGLSTYAARRDMGAISKNTDFTKSIAESMIKGRQLIQKKPQDYLKYAQAYSVVAVAEWEKVIASSVVHYINDLTKTYDQYGTNNYKFESLAKNFSEMKGLALAFEFNPQSQMSREDFEKMHLLLRDTPFLPHQGDYKAYQADLLMARDIIEKSFSFDSENVKEW